MHGTSRAILETTGSLLTESATVKTSSSNRQHGLGKSCRRPIGRHPGTADAESGDPSWPPVLQGEEDELKGCLKEIPRRGFDRERASELCHISLGF